MSVTADLRKARDFLIARRLDHDEACAGFRWPRPERFNFASDWFDAVAGSGDREALRIVSDDGEVASRSYSELAAGSRRVANLLRQAGLRKGDVVLVMLRAEAALWECLLACIRLGAVMIPATTLLDGADLADRMKRGDVRFVVTHDTLTGRFATLQGDWTGMAVGARTPGWISYADADGQPADFASDHESRATDPLLLYFTSGTTAQPKLVVHDQVSYPIGHLSTLYWVGLQPGDVHLNVSSPGWAKHAWSSVFAPWLAEATVLALNHARFDARRTLDLLAAQGVTTFCAPPTVWRMLVQEDLGPRPDRLREAVSAGEPLNPEVIEHVRRAWGLTVRDGFGQTETSAQIGNTPGMSVKPGSVGRPLPGFDIALRPPGSEVAGDEGEICVTIEPHRPVGVMAGYADQGAVTPIAGDAHHTGDIAIRDEDGYIFFVGRTDDVFKSSDYRISPFELESVLIEHPAIAEAAVVPSPDPVRLATPKAFIALAPGFAADAELAQSIFRHCRSRVSNYKRIRRLEILDLPKTISGKIRRVELRLLEADRRMRDERGPLEWLESDFPTIGDLKV